MQTEDGCGARGCVRSDVGWKLMHNGRTKNDSRQLSEVTDLVQLSGFLCSDIFDMPCGQCVLVSVCYAIAKESD